MLELMFVIALSATLTGMAVPQVLAGVDRARARGAARYVAARIYLARSIAVSQRTHVGIRFEPAGAGYQFTVYADGNGNGIRTADVRNRTDRPIAGPERLADQFKDVEFGVLEDLPAVDGSSTPPGDDPIKFGASSILSFSPIGSCSSGSVYIVGHGRQQFVVRVFGDTGPILVLRFEPRTGKWNPQ
jgi:type II secretory pathway pseudopilin PulG